MITNIAQLEDALSEPPPGVIDAMRRLDGDVLLLGVAGKMGPSLARMAKRAYDAAGMKRRVIGVARFTKTSSEQELQRLGIETLRCDLLDAEAVNRLPDAPHVIYMAGMKFGATGQESLTWAMNTWLPAAVCLKYRNSRVVAFSTGNVYGLTQAGSGSLETDPPKPVGEYAMSCLGRERMFEHFSRTQGSPVALIRLNYACDLRYGVLVDLAQRILSGEPVDLAMGWFNTIWQGDANAMTLRALEHVSSPPFVMNMTGPELLNVREVCERLAKRLGRTVTFSGEESNTALLSNAQRSFELFGKPTVSGDELINRVADWVGNGSPLLGKPTHFESRDGQF